MRRAGNDFQFHFTAHLRARLFVEIDYHRVLAADDEQRRRLHARERITCEIGPAAARDDRAHVTHQLGRGDKRGAAASTRSE